jgi:hypothetical protein
METVNTKLNGHRDYPANSKSSQALEDELSSCTGGKSDSNR